SEEKMAHARHKATTRDWPFEVTPLHPSLGCEISGITLAEAVEPKLFNKVYEAFLAYELILFRDVDLPPVTQVAFARAFGEVQIHVMNQYHGYKDFPEIYMLSNLGEDGKPSGKHPDRGTLFWHTDGSWRERTGQATMMYSEIVPPEGGETEFADMYAAYDNLSIEMKRRIEGKRAIHNLDFSRTRRHGEDPMTAEQKAAVPPVAHPVVRTHPETGRKAVFLGDHAQEIEGMDYDEGRALIEELNRLITPQSGVYSHKWRPRECMVWDNRCTLHRATGFDEARHVRVMRRCTVNGDRPF
ncbi:MAG: TauD/TfdA family dioxygenase, partial [Bradyrhizobiaceae bacterium]|nr:TauD/TfdA family dioxygenase [Bradyrhizobiaceae bacterium]